MQLTQILHSFSIHTHIHTHIYMSTHTHTYIYINFTAFLSNRTLSKKKVMAEKKKILKQVHRLLQPKYSQYYTKKSYGGEKKILKHK